MCRANIDAEYASAKYAAHALHSRGGSAALGGSAGQFIADTFFFFKRKRATKKLEKYFIL